MNGKAAKENGHTKEEMVAMMPKNGWGEKGMPPHVDTSTSHSCGVGSCRPQALNVSFCKLVVLKML